MTDATMPKLTEEQDRTLRWLGTDGQIEGAKDRVLVALAKKGLVRKARLIKRGRHHKAHWVRTIKGDLVVAGWVTDLTASPEDVQAAREAQQGAALLAKFRPNQEGA